MTRFEMATILNHRLYILADEERHSIIDKYMAETGAHIDSGAEEADAVAQLGDIDTLADHVLMRHHVDPQKIPPLETACCKTDTADMVGDSGNTTDESDPVTEQQPTEAPVSTRTSLLLSGFFRGVAKIIHYIANLIMFVFLWLPSMAVTAAAVICTTAATFIWLFTGIGFAGICIAGAGCCMMGIAFCRWLGLSVKGDKPDEKNS